MGIESLILDNVMLALYQAYMYVLHNPKTEILTSKERERPETTAAEMLWWKQQKWGKYFEWINAW